MTDTVSAKWERFHTAGIKAAEEGRPERAEGAFRLAISAVESTDAFDPRLAASLSALGKLKLQEKDADGAAALYTRALAIIERAHGGSHAQVVEGLTLLATAHTARGDLDMAEPLLRRALSVAEIVHGFESQDLAGPLNALARLYHKRNEHRKAEPYLSRLLEIKRTLGANHPEVAAVLVSLATCHSAMGQNTAAERVWRDALSIREAQPGTSDELLAPTLEGLADACIAQRKYADAVPLLERAAAIRERTFGFDHALTATARQKLDESRAAVAAAVAVPAPRSPAGRPSGGVPKAPSPARDRGRRSEPRLPFLTPAPPRAVVPTPAAATKAAAAPKAPTPHVAPPAIVLAALVPEPVAPTPIVAPPVAAAPRPATPAVEAPAIVPLAVVPTTLVPPKLDTPVAAAPTIPPSQVVALTPEAKPESPVWAADAPPFLASPMPAPVAPVPTVGPTPAAPALPIAPPIAPPTVPAAEARGMDNAEVIRRHSQNAWLVESEAPAHLETTGALDFKPASPPPPPPASVVPHRRSTQFYVPDLPTQRPAPIAPPPAASPVAAPLMAAPPMAAPLPDLLPAPLPPEPRHSGGVQRASLLAEPIEPPRPTAPIAVGPFAPPAAPPAPPPIRRAPEPPLPPRRVAPEPPPPPRRRSGPDHHAPHLSDQRPRYRRSSLLLGVLTTMILLAAAGAGGLVATGHLEYPAAWRPDSLLAPKVPVDTTPARPALRDRPRISVPIARGAETDPDKIVLVEHGASYAGDKPRVEVQTADGGVADSTALLAAPQIPMQRADLALARVGRAIDDSTRARSDSAARAALKLPTFKRENRE